jgi:hypothetical protein
MLERIDSMDFHAFYSLKISVIAFLKFLPFLPKKWTIDSNNKHDNIQDMNIENIKINEIFMAYNYIFVVKKNYL